MVTSACAVRPLNMRLMSGQVHGNVANLHRSDAAGVWDILCCKSPERAVTRCTGLTFYVAPFPLGHWICTRVICPRRR